VSDELERLETALRSNEPMEKDHLDNLVADVARLPEEEARILLDRLRTELGARAVPLLEAVAVSMGGRMAVVATQQLGRLRDSSAASALQRVAAQTGSGEVRKTARRGLHALASLSVRPAREETVAGKKISRDSLTLALASPFDGLGDRALWLVSDDRGDVELLGLILNEEKGIVDAFSVEMARSRFDREASKVLNNDKLPWVELPVDYCRQLLAEAHPRNGATSTPLPLEYIAWRDRIGRPERAYERPLVYEVINAAEVRWDPRYLDRSANLLGLELFQAWLLQPEQLAEFLREREAARESSLLLVGVDPEVRYRMIVDRAIQTLFDATRRALYKRRLEETAYLLWKLERYEAAKTALAAAMGLEPPDRPLMNHPFLRALMEWNLEAVEAMVRGERTKDIKQGVKLHLPY